MNTLFIISILSFCVLAWTAFSIARHIRRSPAVPADPLEVATRKQSPAPRKSSRRKPARLAGSRT